jgi:hypothetical protein
MQTEDDEERPHTVQDEEAHKGHTRPALPHRPDELVHRHAEQQALKEHGPQPEIPSEPRALCTAATTYANQSSSGADILTTHAGLPFSNIVRGRASRRTQENITYSPMKRKMRKWRMNFQSE